MSRLGLVAARRPADQVAARWTPARARACPSRLSGGSLVAAGPAAEHCRCAPGATAAGGQLVGVEPGAASRRSSGRDGAGVASDAGRTAERTAWITSWCGHGAIAPNGVPQRVPQRVPRIVPTRISSEAFSLVMALGTDLGNGPGHGPGTPRAASWSRSASNRPRAES